MNLQEWQQYCQNFWRTDFNKTLQEGSGTFDVLTENTDSLAYHMLEFTLVESHNRKAQGSDNINLENFQYVPLDVKRRLINQFVKSMLESTVGAVGMDRSITRSNL